MKSPALFLLLLACGDAPTRTQRGPAGPAPQAPATPSLAADPAATPPAATPPAEPRPGDADPQTQAQCSDAVASWLSPTGPGAATATQLNTAGFRCYRSDRLDAAVALFEAALGADNNHALAHYNLAATLSLLRQQRPPCEVDAWLDRILDHLDRSVQLDPERRARLKVDPDFAALAGLPRFRILAGADAGSRKGALQIVQGATFYAPGVGVIGNPALFVLEGAAPHTDLAEGALPVRMVQRSLGEDGQVAEALTQGGWALAPDGTLLLDPDGKGGQQPIQRLRLNAEGDLEGPAGERWLGLPSECEA